MSEKDKGEKVRVTPEPPPPGRDPAAIRFRVTVLDGSLLGKKATFAVRQHVKVMDGRPVDEKKELFTTALYPPNMVSPSHGVSVDWEVQLLHDDLMDWELKGKASVFQYDDFMKA